MLTFDGQAVVVTGAGRGLGRAYALELGRRGGTIVVNDLAADAADAVVGEIRAAGGHAIASHESVATIEGARAIIDTALGVHGAVDAVVNNAGFLRNGLFADLAPEQLDAVVDVHLKGSFLVTQAAWRPMIERGYGRVILTGSSSGVFGNQGLANYAAAKGGLLGLTRALAFEGAEHGVRVNCLLPMAVTTIGEEDPIPGWGRWFRETLGEDGVRAFDRLGDPARVAPLVAFLASQACEVSGEAFSAVCGRYARVFSGIARGWAAPESVAVTAEDLVAHLDEIRDLREYAVPGSLYEEAAEALRQVAAAGRHTAESR